MRQSGRARHRGNSPEVDRELHRRTRVLALTASALTLTGVWAGYSWTQAHREGLQFQTADVAEALVSAVLTFTAGAALGGAARPLRRRPPRLAAYLTLVAPVLILGAVAVQEATDIQVGGSAPVVDVLGVACAILVAAMFGVRLTKARPAGARRGGRARGPWPAWLAGIAIAVPVVLVGGTAGLAAQQAIVNEYDSRPFTHGQRGPVVPLLDRPPGCLAAKPRVWLPVLRTEMSRHCSAFGRLAKRDPAETVSRDVLGYATRRCRQLVGDTKAEPTLWLRRALPAHSPVADATARIETGVEKAVTDETCDAGAKGRD